MTTLRPCLLLAATITGNLLVAFSVRQTLLALGANETFAGGVATTVWSVVAFSMLTSIAVRLHRRYARRARGAANRREALPYPTLSENESLAR